jgi:heptosyltransferase-2
MKKDPLPAVEAVGWKRMESPQRILAVRLQAMGDMLIALPALAGLRALLPDARIDLLTRQEVADIPKASGIFDRVFEIEGGRNFKRQNASALGLLTGLLRRRHQIVIDLQNNPLSNWVSRILFPRAWSRFDRFSDASALIRNQRTIAAAIGRDCPPRIPFSAPPDRRERKKIFHRLGLNPAQQLVLLNPAGYFPSRHWPDTYFARLTSLLSQVSGGTIQFAVCGLPAIGQRVYGIQQLSAQPVLNLTGRTTISEAFELIRHAGVVVSEDSGLMHMAWTSGIPTIALFGSTRADWAAPQGAHSIFFDSSDLECGPCLLERCVYDDNRCLTRISPETVAEQAIRLMREQR